MTTTPGRLRLFAMCGAATLASMGLAATAQQADRVITLRFPADVPPGVFWTADVRVPTLGTIVVRGQVQSGVLPLTGLSVGIYSGGEKEGWKTCTWLLNPPAHSGIDCLTFLTGPHLASGLLDADGRFSAQLPDLASDPALPGRDLATLQFYLGNAIGHEVAELSLAGAPKNQDIPADAIASPRATMPVFDAVPCVHLAHAAGPGCVH